MSSSDKINVLGYTISFLILLGSSAIPTGMYQGHFTIETLREHFRIFSFFSPKIQMIEDRGEWQGKWFPKKPGEADPQLDDVNNGIDSSTSSFKRLKTMGIQDPNCDDAEVFMAQS